MRPPPASWAAPQGAAGGVELFSLACHREVFDWGLRFERVAVSLTLYAEPDLAAAIRAQASALVRVIDLEVAGEPGPAWKLARLREASEARQPGTRACYWIDLGLCYRHLSFEYLYSPWLVRTLVQAERPVFFPVPGYPAHSLFGGPCAALADLPATVLEAWEEAGSRAPGFEDGAGPRSGDDPNLYFAEALAEPVLHAIGDSHVYNCLTPNQLIGCRANVLFGSADAQAGAAPFRYQFSHHLGGRTLHRMGREGELEAQAQRLGLKAGDGVIWVFGEIDVRCHVVRQQLEYGRALDEVVQTLAQRFVAQLQALQSQCPGLRQMVLAPIPPLDNPDYRSDDFPVFGDITQRIEARRLLAAHLLAHCRRQGFLFLDIAPGFETARGDLQWALSDRFCHLSHGYQDQILAQAYALFAACGQTPPR